jgi:hypothetical protein
MLASLDIFYPAMATVEKSAKAGDQAAAATAFGQAEEAINTIVNSVEAETREGRLNSIKVSLAVLVGKDTAEGLNVYQENMKEMRRRAKEGGEGGGKKMAGDYNMDYLGALPLDINIRLQADNGRPTVVADPDGEVAGIYKAVARKVAVSIAAKNKDFSAKFPTITISKNT